MSAHPREAHRISQEGQARIAVARLRKAIAVARFLTRAPAARDEKGWQALAATLAGAPEEYRVAASEAAKVNPLGEVSWAMMVELVRQGGVK